MRRIVTILPKGEGFSPQHFGAVALCVRDFTSFSRYQETITVIGGTATPGFDGIQYASPPPARWYQNRTRAYASGAARIIHERNAELVEIHNRPVLLKLLHRRVTCRLALHLHNDPQDMDGTATPSERMRVLEMCDGIYCVSAYIRDRFLDGLPDAAERKTFIIHNGIELPQALPPKEKLIAYAGRMTEGKGALLLAKALHLALPQLPGWRAILIGSRRHEAGRPLTAHEQEIADLITPLAPQAELTGFLSHPQTLDAFARAAIAVVPSVWEEPFGRTALEAMAYGCAVVSSGRGGLSEVTADAALTPDSLTSQTIAEALLKLAQNENECHRLQTAARQRAAHFAIAACAAKLDDARDVILNQSNRHAA